MTEISAGKLWGLRRLADENGVFKIITADQRPAIKDIVAQKRDVEEAAYDDVIAVKRALVEALSMQGSATVVDPHYGYPAAFDALAPRRGLLIALEDSVFAETPDGRLSKEIDDWSVEKIKRAGADGVKMLNWYRPDANPHVLENQKAFAKRVGEACAKYDIPFVQKVLVYSFPKDSAAEVDYFKQPEKATEHVFETVEEFTKPEYGVDLPVLQSPVIPSLVPSPFDADPDAIAVCQAHFNEMSRIVKKPWIIASAGTDRDSYRHILHYAHNAGASGYLAGRATWWDVFSAFPNMPAMIRTLEEESAPFLAELSDLADEMAVPWMRHAAFAPDGPVLGGFRDRDFRTNYSEFEPET